MICLLFLEIDTLLSTAQTSELLPALSINKTPFKECPASLQPAVFSLFHLAALIPGQLCPSPVVPAHSHTLYVTLALLPTLWL